MVLSISIAKGESLKPDILHARQCRILCVDFCVISGVTEWKMSEVIRLMA
jgi:hypothetical protein